MIPHNDISIQIGSQAHPGPETLKPDMGDPVRLWLVDDNNDFRNLLALLLADAPGFDCSRGFPSAATMLEALACETPPDVILLDVHMGGECGLDAIRPIKSLAASTHVLMLTTCYDSIYRKRAFCEGATDFLLKSYSAEQIVHRIRRAMKQPVPGVLASALAEGKPERVRISARASSSGEDESAAEFADGGFSKHDLCKRNLDRGWPAVWRRASNRFVRGAFFVRSWLAVFF